MCIKLRVLIGMLVLCFVFSLNCSGLAQSVNPEPSTLDIKTIKQGIAATNLQWIDQGSEFIFLDATLTGRYVPLETENSIWYSYNVGQETLDISSIWPAQPDIPTSLESIIYPNSIAFSSPDGDYLVFASNQISSGEQKNQQQALVFIYEIKTQIIIATDIPFGDGATSVALSEVIWSDERVFIIGITPSEGGLAPVSDLYYVDFREEVYYEQITVFEVEGIPFIMGGFFDISDDGNQVLLNAGDQVALWNIQASDEVTLIPRTEIDGTHLLDAQFAQSDGSEFVYFNNAGVGSYNINNAYNNIIVSVDAEVYREAQFSPTNDIIAAADTMAVYLIDLRDQTQNLRLASSCSPDPDTVRLWRVRTYNF